MPRTHVVVEGENLSTIAAREGFRDFRKLYEAPENAELRKKRPNPNLILPGDEVVIPDRKPLSVKVAPGAKVTIQKLPPVAMPDALEVAFIDPQNGPIPKLKVQLVTDKGQLFERTSDDAGLILLQEKSLSTDSVIDVVSIVDDTEKQLIDYSEFRRPGLRMNSSTTITFPNKRAIINRIMAKHKIERRASWKARDPKATMPQDWDFDMIVIHHSGDTGQTDPKKIQDLHMDGDAGFDDVAYQFMVRPSGSIVEGRYLSHKGAANAAQNTGKLAIIVLGDFEHDIFDFDDDPTPAQITSANLLATTLAKEFPTIKRLVGHRDIKPDTECPGGELHKRLVDIRKGTGLKA
jgi:hypothetical protein